MQRILWKLCFRKVALRADCFIGCFAFDRDEFQQKYSTVASDFGTLAPADDFVPRTSSSKG
jgi:hypothetical protein